MWRGLGQDVGYGMRILRRNPGFAALAVTTLALGIGAGTACSLVAAALLAGFVPAWRASRVDAMVALRAE